MIPRIWPILSEIIFEYTHVKNHIRHSLWILVTNLIDTPVKFEMLACLWFSLWASSSRKLWKKVFADIIKRAISYMIWFVHKDFWQLIFIVSHFAFKLNSFVQLMDFNCFLINIYRQEIKNLINHAYFQYDAIRYWRVEITLQTITSIVDCRIVYTLLINLKLLVKNYVI